MTDLTSRVHDVLPSVLDDLEALVRIPSIWAQPEHHDDVRRSADEVERLLREAGFAQVRIVEAGGAPAVIAHHPAPPGAPTVLLYAHHDVQPTGDPALWTSPPFEPTRRGDRLYARGAADDKAGLAAHLAAFRAHGGNPPVGVTVFVEGEEESGSPSLVALLERHRDELTADAIVIADSANWSIGVPALTVTLRGMVDCVVTVETLGHAVHSGIWGGVVPDALTTLAQLLATLHDADGAVAVEGLHRGVAADLEYPEDRFREESSVLPGVQQIGRGSIVQRLWAEPAVSVLGIDATPVATASNTLSPSARAKIGMRVAPGGDAATHLDALVTHLESHAPFGARVTVERGDLGEPFTVDANGPAYDAARSAFRDAWDGTEPVDMGMGGSIPFIAEFARLFPDAAVLVTGVEDPDTRAHGIDEGLHLGEFSRVCVAEALLLQRLADQT
ncbi:dipeptidase [Aeromicrobium fastidiosum]|uniref:Dipeptidase n=1 Tax=Aeromicrobium fastidiosum TaxID=52699 RepID=A0A641AM54_9ACTN|nr:dipeptidase [Aeromicrobium fastidiosum]KAA1374944.1 dipeptidase [Aeromicrobium fastidiosum]MBP2390482.1 acetylornithine deacetylase/succinyl-diaminopimelate desuccinylase-like protein [Aeromicrobium fastidiosum]